VKNAAPRVDFMFVLFHSPEKDGMIIRITFTHPLRLFARCHAASWLLILKFVTGQAKSAYNFSPVESSAAWRQIKWLLFLKGFRAEAHEKILKATKVNVCVCV